MPSLGVTDRPASAGEDGAPTREGKSAEAFRTISEVADELGVAQHVLRFWESKFPQIKPLKRGGGRRYYRPEDVHLLRGVQRLLYREGYTIKGAQKLLREHGARSLIEAMRQGQGLDAWRQGEAPAAPPAGPPASPGLDKARRRRLEAVAAELKALSALLKGSS